MERIVERTHHTSHTFTSPLIPLKTTHLKNKRNQLLPVPQPRVQLRQQHQILIQPRIVVLGALVVRVGVRREVRLVCDAAPVHALQLRAVEARVVARAEDGGEDVDVFGDCLGESDERWLR